MSEDTRTAIEAELVRLGQYAACTPFPLTAWLHRAVDDLVTGAQAALEAENARYKADAIARQEQAIARLSPAARALGRKMGIIP